VYGSTPSVSERNKSHDNICNASFKSSKVYKRTDSIVDVFDSTQIITTWVDQPKNPARDIGSAVCACVPLVAKEYRTCNGGVYRSCRAIARFQNN